MLASHPLALINGKVFTPTGFRTDLAVLIENGLIKALCPPADLPVGVSRLDLKGGLLLPGFIDSQVNGGGGALFNDTPSVSSIATMAEAHRHYGTTGFLATLISDTPDKIAAALDAVKAGLDQGVPGLIGAHIEGPFLNPARKGVHNPELFCALTEDLADLILEKAAQFPTLITLAPEKNDPALIRRLVAGGIRVAAGHSDATYEEARLGIDAGISAVTHLFNAMSPLTTRKPGLVGAALEDDALYCPVILDGAHLHAASARIAFKCKGVSRLMLVTDAMPTVGMLNKVFDLQGRTIRVENAVCVDENGTLAGSDLDMASAVRNCVKMLDTSLDNAVRMASEIPATFLGLGHRLGKIAPGYQADLVWTDDTIQVIDTFIRGERDPKASAVAA